ncbi:PASTA domain-containing protein [Brachyspira innocens]|uniref:PASTA domain-containing protein n=1 Tax=Brachyspira innocens TaxID=13264 RepID=A0ABT8YY25_9SPIR|nr:PASTA domain-containing protein [Brachyspira innocens]MDO6994077.1 PASTA domain-containing protein [Brachyspira innocens]MDO7020506.1 PASTA domain-containing protein [Brachyspira innocens]
MSRKKNKPEINTKEKQEKTEIKIEKVEKAEKIEIKKDNKQFSNILDKIIFYIKKFISIILPDGIVSDSKSLLVFGRLTLFALIVFVLQILVVCIVVFVIVKSGGESFVLPDVQGKEVFQAFNTLEKEGMNLNIQTHYFNNYPLGTVVSQEPKGGIKVKRGRTVYLVINVAEQALVKMPDVTGIKYEEALSIITNDVLSTMTNVTILPKVEINDSLYENDIVVSQIPAAEDVVSMNTEIILTVNNKKTQNQQ